jgi:hypothetical protein
MRADSTGERGVLTFEKEILNQKNEVVQTGTTTILLARRDPNTEDRKQKTESS